MALNKQGFVFTGIVLVIITLTLISYVIIHQVTDRLEIKQRVQTLDSFVFSTEQDLQRQVYISGFRGLFTIQDYMAREGRYLLNTEEQLSEEFFNGTLYGISQSLLLGTIFSDIQTTLQTRSEKVNLNASLQHTVLVIDQNDPWKVEFSLQGQLQVKDKNGLAQVIKNVTINASIPIDNFEDPVYVISTQGLLTNKIRKTPFTQFANPSNLLNHTLGGYYKGSSLAPRFIDRLQGNLSASPQGIESLVNLQALSAQGGQVQSKSIVDYIYFSTDNPSSTTVPSLPSWVRLDDAHLGTYTS